MSEAGQIRELGPEFLRVAYEIGMNEPSDIVMLHQVAEYINTDDLDITGSEYVDKLSKVAQYLGNRGFLERQSSDWSMFSITREGIDEVEDNRRQEAGSTTNFNFNAPIPRLSNRHPQHRRANQQLRLQTHRGRDRGEGRRGQGGTPRSLSGNTRTT